MRRPSGHRDHRLRLAAILRGARRDALDASRLTSEVRQGISELRRSAESDAVAALEVTIEYVRIVARIASGLTDTRGFFDGAIDSLAAVIVDLAGDTSIDEAGSERRREALTRLVELWARDEGGVLERLEECVIGSAVSQADEDFIVTAARAELRIKPFVFPPSPGRRFDSHRRAIVDQRFRIERLIGEFFSRHGRHDYAIATARRHADWTSDGYHLALALVRAGREDEAFVVTRRYLHRAGTTRRDKFEELHTRLLAQREGDENAIEAARRHIVDEPCVEAFERLKAIVPKHRWKRTCASTLGTLEKRRTAPELCFELYVEEGLLLEADGMVTTQSIDAEVLAAAAKELPEEQRHLSAGWLLVAAYRILRRNADAAAYRRTAEWLADVQRSAAILGQCDGFRRAIQDFKRHYGRRKALMDVLADHGL